MDLSIITPAHNEENLIKNFVDQAVSFIKKNKINGEVIVVENGSTDNTANILNNLNYKELKVVNLPTGNKGLALKTGLETAFGKKLVTLDTDLWDEDFVKMSIEKLEEVDVIVASKFLSSSKDQRPLFRRLVSAAVNFIMRALFNFKGTDSKAKISFRKDKILPLVKQCKTEQLIFDTELIIRAERAGLKKLEVPTSVIEIRPKRFSTIYQAKKTITGLWVLVRTLGITPNWTYLILIAAFGLGIFTRFYNYKDFLFFAVDEEHYAYMTRMITVNHHFPLIGGPISGTRLYMAPWFLYFSAIWFLVFNNSVVLTGMVFAGIGLATSFVVYLISKSLFSTRAALISFVLYTGSFFIALFDRHYWNLTLVPFLSTLTVYLLLKKRTVLLGVVVGFGLSNTFSMMAVFLFAAAVLLLRKNKDILIFLFVVAIMHFPLVIFDFRHNFWLLHALGDFFIKTSQTSVPFVTRFTSTLWLLVTTLGKSLAITSPLDISSESSICLNVVRFSPNILLTVLSIIILLWYFVKKKNGNLWIPFLLLLVNFFSLFIFRGDGSERHFLPFIPVFLVLAGGFIASLNTKLGTILVVLIVALNIYSFTNSLASHGYSAKERAVKFVIDNTKPQEFSLDVTGGSCFGWGYRYQFSYFNHEPSSSYLDYDFSWMYDVAPKPDSTKTIVVIDADDTNNVLFKPTHKL